MHQPELKQSHTLVECRGFIITVTSASYRGYHYLAYRLLWTEYKKSLD